MVSLAGSTVVFALLGLLVAPLPLAWRFRVITTWTRYNLGALGALCGLRHEVEGLEHLPEEASVIVCKHQSAWETLALQTLAQPQTWVLKRELLWIPFFGWGLALLEPIAIDRRDPRGAVKTLLVEGPKRLARGIWVVVFPEGTRVAPGARRPYQRGGAALARRARRALVPIAHDAGRYWPRRGFLKHPGRIRLVIGPPINPEGLSTEELNARAERWIEETVARLLADPAAREGSPGRIGQAGGAEAGAPRPPVGTGTGEATGER